MRRAILTILLVAGLAALIACLENAGGRESPDDWLRTVDGWQRRQVVELPPREPQTQLHPSLVAGFQLSASILALAMFPSRATTIRPPMGQSAAPLARRRRRRRVTANIS